MITGLIISFWIGIFLLIYHYVLYPLILNSLAKSKQFDHNTYKNDELPFISILLAAYNEEDVILEKIESTFRTTYPLEKIEFLIGSDASNDKTEEIIESFKIKHPQISLSVFKGRTGKPQIINNLVKKSSGDILILTDANVFFEKDCLFELVKHFKTKTIGLVGGNILNLITKTDGISNQEKAYLSGENIIKYNEGLIWGSMMGAFGGLFALRKSAYKDVPKGFLVDDFFITMNVLLSKFKAINSLKAIAYEDVSNMPKEEFRRKVRIGIGNFQNLFKFKKIIYSRFGISFPFISHKIIRWIGPFILINLITILPFIRTTNLIYDYIALGIILMIISPLLDKILQKINIHIKLLRFVSHFVMMNLALLVGFFKFTIGVHDETWTPTKRNQ